ncbi:MAG TPA: hypothetical protein VMT39_03250 [Candidatus Bathyarchaeia archaeon]|nr:hypothetical protein [Candidatus Bathyarchaeia archaeon]
MAGIGTDRKGVPALLAVLLAIVGMTYLPRPSAEPGNPSESSAPAQTANPAHPEVTAPVTEPRATVECRNLFDRIHRFFGGSEYYPASCFPGAKNPPRRVPPAAPADLNFVIAIAPNPVQTHLPLLFDRSVAAIQQAAQDEGYTYDGSWFPWNDSATSGGPSGSEADNQAVQQKVYRQPGVLVFRRGFGMADEQDRPYSGGLIVFLVGEQPTGGIDDLQFEHAMQWLNTLQPNTTGKNLKILGPTFTGSLPSLARELTVETIRPYTQSVEIFSGSVTSDEGVKQFKQFLLALGTKLKKPDLLTFRTFSEGDGVMTNRFLCFLRNDGYQLSRVAILSEDQTAFGHQRWDPRVNNPGAGNNDEGILKCGGREVPTAEGPINLYYPRDIASLRSAYEKQSIFSAGKQQAGGNAPATTLRGDLSESPSSEHDAVRSYAAQLTPLDQEAVLFGISNALNDNRVEYVLIRSSNTLDQLFLSEFLRRSYPGVRIVVDGSDLLLRRGMEGASLRGVLLLSTYPLFDWTQDAGPTFRADRSGSHRVFAQDVTEGLYIATRALLVPSGDQTVPISDFAPPRWALAGEAHIPDKCAPDDEKCKDWKRPATWIAVVGHRRFWPVAVLNSNTQAEPPGDNSILEPKQEQYYYGKDRPTRLPGEMVSLFVFCVLLALWHSYCCAKGSISKPPRVRAYFAPTPWLQHTSLIFLGSLLVGLLAVLLWFVASVGRTMLLPVATASVGAGILVIYLSAFLGCVQNYRLHVVSGQDSTLRRKALERIRTWRKLLPWAWIPALALLALLRYLYLTSHVGLANEFPAYWRSIYLRSGVSPLLPQVLLILGLYAWCWFNLHGLALFGDDRPLLPKVDALPQYEISSGPGEEEPRQHTRVVKAFLMFSHEGAGANIERNAFPLGRPYLKSLAVFLPVALAALWIALGDPSLRTLGDRRFGTVIFAAIVLYIALILADTAQLLNSWSRLRELLTYLDRLRLRRTLGTLRGLYGGSVWKLSGNVLEERYRLISRQFESLRNLQNALADWTVSNAAEGQRKQIAIDQVAQCDQRGRAFAAWYVDLLDDQCKRPGKEYDITPLTEFQESLAATAGCIVTQVVLPAWQTDTQSMLRSTGSGDKDADFAKLVDALPAHVRAAEEFFLLPYMGFIQNILGRVRTIGISIVVLFVAVTVGVSSYPFDPLPVIGAVFLILFALVGAVLIFSYAGMCRDATLSRIADTNPGELGWDFWVKMVALGTGPLLGLLTTLFPSMTDFVVSFLQPGAQAIK